MIGVLEMSGQLPSFGKIENRTLSPRAQPNCAEQLLPGIRSQRQPHVRGDDRQQITRAREAAEALFRPKRQIIEPPVAETPAPADSLARKPRVLTIASPALVYAEREAPVTAEQQIPPEIPRSQFARIRAWVKYGMTVGQAAEVCGVAVGEVERILQKV
jgi:hypothetical protein